MEEYEIQIEILNSLGTFQGEVLFLTSEQHNEIKQRLKNFHLTGFELHCEDGSLMVIPPDVIRNSILKIKYLNN
jgi:hypothetical protein